MRPSDPSDPRLKEFVKRIKCDVEIRQNRNVAPATYLSFGPVPVFIDAEPSARRLKCYFNVRDMVVKHGGSSISGWSFYNDDDDLFMAQHHAIWERPDHSIVDVTPNDHLATSILFVADERVPFDYKDLRMPPALKWHAITKQHIWLGPEDHLRDTNYFLLRAEEEDPII